MTFECPRQGNSCSECLLIAKGAFEDGLARREPDLTKTELGMRADDAKLRGPIEDRDDNWERRSCAASQSRAYLLGKQAALREMYGGNE